jgi:hypothetical protein
MCSRTTSELEALRREVADLRERGAGVEYRGVWREGTTYARGSMVTDGGCVWHCNTHGTSIRPKEHTSDWTLAVRAGRDGR